MTNTLYNQRNFDGRLNVCVVSLGTSESLGGLASYMRFLTRHLCRDCLVSAVGRYQVKGPNSDYSAFETPKTIDNGLFQTRIIAPKRAFLPALRQLHHLTSRKVLRHLAVWLFAQAYQSSLSTAIPSGANVIHYVGTGWELLGFAALSEARKRGAVFTVLPAVHPGTWGDNVLDIHLYNQADAILTLSNMEKQYLVSLGVKPELIHTIVLAPATQTIGNNQRFRNRHNLGSRPIILFIGRKDKGKGYHALRQSMGKVLSDVPNACLVTIGPDNEPPYPPVAENALLDLGKADDQEKEDALAACDIFCLPSAQESFGIVYVEAWAYSKPVIGGPAPAVREMITDGINGFCSSQNPDEIAAFIIRLLSDSSLCQSLGMAGQKLQQSRYNWDTVTEMHKTLFTTLCQSKSGISLRN